MMDFSAGAGQSSGNGDCIPNGQLAWVIINVRGLKVSSKTGSQYLDVELTLDDGQPYARRKVWEMIGDPNYTANTADYRQMGIVALSRILEAGRDAGPNNPAGYRIDAYEQLSGLRVPVKLKIEKGTGGYDDKNKVAEWLTPNPASSGYKDYQLLLSGVHNKAAQGQAKPAADGFGGFGGQQQPAAQTQLGFGQPQPQGASQSAASAAGGWPQAEIQQGTGGAQNATSPSDHFPTQDVPASFQTGANQPANWLAQANGSV